MLNKVQFIGRLGADPDVRFTPDGAQVTGFRVASDYVRKDKSGSPIKETEWLSCVAWGKLAEICGNFLVKGRLVYVEGRLKTRAWEDKDGVKRFKTEAILTDMRILEAKKKAEDNQTDGSDIPTGEFLDDDIPF